MKSWRRRRGEFPKQGSLVVIVVADVSRAEFLRVRVSSKELIARPKRRFLGSFLPECVSSRISKDWKYMDIHIYINIPGMYHDTEAFCHYL